MNRLIQIVNNAVANYINAGICFPFDKDDFLIGSSTQFIHLKTNKFDKIFSSNAVDQKNVARSFFHYKSFNFGLGIVENNKINASALSNYNTSDIEEYRHFFATTLAPYDTTIVENRKNELFVICLTEDNSTDRFWTEYADDSKGICIEFIFENMTTDIQNNSEFDLREIFYANGNNFQFLRTMQDDIHRIFGKYLLIPGISKFSAFYKRSAQFSWERETRLFFNWEFYKANFAKELTLVNHGTKTFLEINFANKWFTLKIESVTAGKNLTPVQLKDLEDLTTRKGIRLYK